MKNIKNIIIGLTFITYFGCDTVEGPYIENPDNLISTVTILEFTGINCVYCPENGHEKVAEYQEKFGKNLQAISIHGKEFGDPIEEFMLATREGEDLALSMVVNNLPKGSANTLAPGSTSALTALGDEIAKVGYKFPDLVLNVSMEIEESKAQVKITGLFDEVLSENYSELNICVYLVQNHIIGPQKDHRGDHKNYEHKHVFRKSFNGILGELYVANPTNGMDVDELIFSMDLTEERLLVLETGQTIEDLELEPFVFVYKNDNKSLIPFFVNYN